MVDIHVDRSDEPNPDPDDFPHAGIVIEPDQLTLLAYDGVTMTEVDQTRIESAQDAWYTLRFLFAGDRCKRRSRSVAGGG